MPWVTLTPTVGVHASSHALGGADRVYPSAIGEHFDLRRSSEVSTMPRVLTAATVGTIASGSVYGALAYARTAGTFTKIRFATGATVPAGLTDARGIVWAANRTWMADTGNQIATVVAASTMYELTLSASVTLTEGQQVWLGVGFVGTTPPLIRGFAGISTILAAAPMLATSASGWTAGTQPPTLGAGGAGQYVWAELVP